MVELIITVEVLDKNDKRLNVTDEELKETLYVCHSETGESLKSPWLVSDDANEYIIEASDKSSNTGTIRYVYKYISCSKHEFPQITEKISVGINIPGVGKFDTSHNGTSTKGTNGHVFKSPKSFDIMALRPIDYGIHDNIKIECGDFETISHSVKWTCRVKKGGPFENHLNGVAKRRIAHIRPNKSATGEEKFKKYEIIHDPIRNGDVSTGTNLWSDSDEEERGFSMINESYGKPCAVIGRGYSNSDYQVNLWYSRKNNIKIDGKFYVVDSKYEKFYVYKLNETPIEENHSDDDEDGAATLLLYKFILPESNKSHTKWDDVFRKITVNVTDYYGNEGSFQLVFDDKDKFDLPGLL